MENFESQSDFHPFHEFAFVEQQQQLLSSVNYLIIHFKSSEQKLSTSIFSKLVLKSYYYVHDKKKKGNTSVE